MEFSFNTGDRVITMAKRVDNGNACMFQRIAFTTTPYLTNVEVWLDQDGRFFVYAEPSNEVKALLP